MEQQGQLGSIRVSEKGRNDQGKNKNTIKETDFVNWKRQMPSGLSVYLEARLQGAKPALV